MSSEMIWLIALIITHLVAFWAGMDYRKPYSATHAFLIDKYKIEKEYEHKRWLAERKGEKHEEQPDDPQE